MLQLQTKKHPPKQLIKHLENQSCCSTPLWPDGSTQLYATCGAANGQATIAIWITMNNCSRRS
jgi:hypothetical protein